MPKFYARAGATAMAAAVLTLVSGAVAQAHVRVIPESTAAGGYTKLTFRVPNESETAGTTKLTVSLPTDTPLASVRALPVYGWTATITEAKLPKPVVDDGTTLTEAPATVTWTAAKGQAVGPGQFQEFSLSAGPIPKNAKELSFPSAQTYSDGTVVKWDQPQAAGSAEPEHPVPAFAVTAALPDGGTAAAAPAGALSPTSATTSGDDVNEGLLIGLAVGGLVAGLLGLTVGGLAWRKAARTA
jgi:uncharacterized protein YcnI